MGVRFVIWAIWALVIASAFYLHMYMHYSVGMKRSHFALIRGCFCGELDEETTKHANYMNSEYWWNIDGCHLLHETKGSNICGSTKYTNNDLIGTFKCSIIAPSHLVVGIVRPFLIYTLFRFPSIVFIHLHPWAHVHIMLIYKVSKINDFFFGLLLSCSDTQFSDNLTVNIGFYSIDLFLITSTLLLTKLVIFQLFFSSFDKFWQVLPRLIDWSAENSIWEILLEHVIHQPYVEGIFWSILNSLLCANKANIWLKRFLHLFFFIYLHMCDLYQFRSIIFEVQWVNQVATISAHTKAVQFVERHRKKGRGLDKHNAVGAPSQSM